MATHLRDAVGPVIAATRRVRRSCCVECRQRPHGPRAGTGTAGAFSRGSDPYGGPNHCAAGLFARSSNVTRYCEFSNPPRRSAAPVLARTSGKPVLTDCMLSSPRSHAPSSSRRNRWCPRARRRVSRRRRLIRNRQPDLSTRCYERHSTQSPPSLPHRHLEPGKVLHPRGKRHTVILRDRRRDVRTIVVPRMLS